MKRFKIFIFGLLAVTAVSIKAQTPAATPLDPVISKFNTGAGKVNTGDFTGAITDFEEVIVLADKVGATANDLKSKAKEQIPALHYKVATGLINQKKFIDAVSYLEKTIELADSYANNQPTKEKATKLLPSLMVAVGTQLYKEKNSDEAMKYFQSAIKYAPGNAKAHLGVGMIYAEKNDDQKMVSSLQKAIEIAKTANDQATIDMAQKRMGLYFINVGNVDLSEIDNENPDYSYAITSFEKAVSFDPGAADAYYTLALIYNKKLEFPKAIENAKKALEYEKDAVRIAEINYELGVAYFSIAELDKACESYKKALVGEIAEKTRAKMEKVPGCN